MKAGAAPREDRATLEREWLTLTRKVLPDLARFRSWPVVDDHCFQRILFDAVVGGVWYDAVQHRPAYRHIDHGVLMRALALGYDVAEGRADLDMLNEQSLLWRRARKRADRRGTR